jgi:hypothetical protein
MNLPDNPTELAALLRQIEKRAAELAIEIDRKVYAQRPDSVRRAVDLAVSVLYFHGDGQYSKSHAALIAIVSELAPEISEVLVNEGYTAAYRILHPEEKT